MIATLLLVLAADPSGLSTAMQTADRLEIVDMRRRSVTVPNSDLKGLAKLIKCEGEAHRFGATPGAAIVVAYLYNIRVLDKDGRTIGRYSLVNNAIHFDGNEVTLANDAFRNAIREYFEGPRPKAVFRPKIVDELHYDTNIGALTVRQGGWIVFGVDHESKRLHVIQTGSAGSGLLPMSRPAHDKLVAPHAIAATNQFVYVAGSSGIAGFRSRTRGDFKFEPSEFIRDKAITLHVADGKLYAAREADIWVYAIAGAYGRLRFQDVTLVHPLLKHPTAMASANGCH